MNDPKLKKWLGQVVGKESEDLSRHDKWLFMMYPRLKLLHKLLAEDGAIFISIDDNEQANLKLICDEIFGRGNFVAETIIHSCYADLRNMSQLLEYVLEIVNDPNSTILDSFAGSGTTAHAVLNLNKQDGGNRKFILIEMEDYAEIITAERVMRVIKGNSEKEGTGGSFDYYTLGEPIFTEGGNLNKNIEIEKIRQYIFYTETKIPLTETDNNDNAYFLGKYNDTAYYFNYEKEAETALDYDFLATLQTKAEQYVVYADNCFLSKEYMTKRQIIFKKIPRDITRF